jgi:hypothetical protein
LNRTKAFLNIFPDDHSELEVVHQKVDLIVR